MGPQHLTKWLFPALISKTSISFSFVFWLHLTAYEILVPQPGIKPRAPAVRAPSPDHWTAKEFPDFYFLLSRFQCIREGSGHKSKCNSCVKKIIQNLTIRQNEDCAFFQCHSGTLSTRPIQGTFCYLGGFFLFQLLFITDVRPDFVKIHINL